MIRNFDPSRHWSGMDANSFAEGISSDEIKNKLRENTEFAINKGAFGVPTFYIDDEMYWGIDSMKFLVEYLKINNQPLSSSL